MKTTTKNVFDHPINNDEDFNEAFSEFLNMRKRIRKPATERAIKLLLVTLIDLSEGNTETAVKIIDRSTVNCWLDFYRLKQEENSYNVGNQKKLTDI